MAESNHDDLADALARLAGGDVAPSERDHGAEAPPTPPPAAPRPPAAKPTFRPATAPPAPPRSAMPAPQPPRAVTPQPPAPARPTAPARAPQPAAAVTPAPARPQRPAVPTRPLAPPPPNLTPPEDPSLSQPASEDVVDDDDAVIVPAPDASVFVPKKKPVTSAEARARVARHKQIEFRRTLIPILLTTGVLSIGFGLAPMVQGRDSMAAALPNWVVPTLLGTGAVLLLLAIANMASVRSMLLADARRAATGAH